MRAAQRDECLDERLIERPTPATPPRQPPAASSARQGTMSETWPLPVRDAPAPKPTPRRPRAAPARLGDLYARVGKSVALLGFLALAGLLWYAGASFTLAFLQTWYPVSRLGLLQWLIPLAITTTEVFLWPRWRTSLFQWLGFLAVLLFDVGTTVSGLLPLLAGRQVDLFGGFQLPTVGVWLYTVAVAGGLLLAYGPEKLGTWALRDLYGLWRE